MKLNLDGIKTEIESYLQKNDFVIFYGFARGGEIFEVEWDTVHYPDYKLFLDAAKRLNVKMIVLHHREFSARTIDQALEEMDSEEYEFEDQRALEQRLREFRAYDGFTCTVEISFELENTVYRFELRADWYDEINEILEQLDLSGDDSDEFDEDEEPGLGGYYSKN
jgi:hypothetical protein